MIDHHMRIACRCCSGEGWRLRGAVHVAALVKDRNRRYMVAVPILAVDFTRFPPPRNKEPK